LSRIPSDGTQTKQPESMSSVGVLDPSGSAVPHQEVAAVQANYSGDKQTEAKQTEVSLTDTSAVVEDETKTDVLSRIPSDGTQTKQPESMSSVGVLDPSGSAVPHQEVAAVQANYNGDKQTEAKQTEVSLTDTSAVVEDEKQTVLGKRSREEDAEQDCSGEVGLDVSKT
jgi:anti-sigma28 factor (negative regulator of flagellin synthesis)